MTPCPQVTENEEKLWCGLWSCWVCQWHGYSMVQHGDQSVCWLRILRRLLLLAQFLTVLRNCIWGEPELNVDGSRTNSNANPFDGKCHLELQTKPLLLNCCIWGHRGSQASEEPRYKSHGYSKNRETTSEIALGPSAHTRCLQLS